MTISYKTGRDINGNKILRITRANRRGFSIQTNGNLPETDRNGLCPATAGEVAAYVSKYGTDRQKEVIGS